MQRIFLFLSFFCLTAFAFAAEVPNDLFGRLRVQLIDADGVELKTTEEVQETKAVGVIRQWFEFKDQTIVVASCVDPASRTVVYRVESPHLESGEVQIGFLFPKESRLPKTSVTGNRATFECKRGTTFMGWAGSATLTTPKPREELKVSLAEYGANDRWAEVTEKVQNLIVGDSLDFRPGNALFGDPASGVVKRFTLAYSLGEDDEQFSTFSENQPVRIQFDPKDRFFRLKVGQTSAFEFVVAISSTALPEKLPTFAEARKHAESVDVPSSFSF